MKTYRVTLGIIGTVSCDVEANEEDSAMEIARDIVDNTNMEWSLGDPYSDDNVQLLFDDEQV